MMLCALFLFILCTGNSHLFDVKLLQLTQQYFSWKNISNVNIFSCNKYDEYKMMHFLTFSKNNNFITGSGIQAFTNDNLQTMMIVRYTKLGIFIDIDCDCNKNILKQCKLTLCDFPGPHIVRTDTPIEVSPRIKVVENKISSKSAMFNESYIWLAWSRQDNVTQNIFLLNLGLTSDFVLVTPKFILYDLYKVNYSTEIIQEIAAEWNSITGLSTKLNGTFVNRRSNFYGIHLKGTVVLTKLMTNSTNAEERILDTQFLPHLDAVSRFTYILFLNLQDMYNFKLSFQVSDSWGYLLPEGGHDGMVGQLERGEIDLGLTPATMFKHRMDTTDFTAPVWKFRTCFIFRQPKTLGVYKALVMPLSPAAWLVTSGLCVLVVAALRTVHYCLHSDVDLSWSASILLVIGALSQQGLSSTSNRVPVRILSLFLLVLSVVLYAFYGAAIVTSLLTPPAKSIHTIRQLLDSSIGMGVENTAYTRDYFSKSTDPLTAELYRKKLLNRMGFLAISEGIERMRTKKFAFYAEDATLYLPIEKSLSNIEKCSLTEIELFPPYLVSTPVRKMSPLRDFISCGFNLMRERGILHRENSVWHPRRPACIGEKQVARVDLEAVMLAFIILAAGMVSSLIILGAEKAAYAYNSTNLNQTVISNTKTKKCVCGE